MMSHVVGATIVRGGNILLLHRFGYDDWTLPGGVRFPKEPDFDAIRRLLNQDLGIDVDSFLRPVITESGRGLKGWGTIRLTCYLLENAKSQIQLRFGHNELSWVPPAALPNYPMTEVDKKILSYLDRNGYLPRVAEAAA